MVSEPGALDKWYLVLIAQSLVNIHLNLQGFIELSTPVEMSKLKNEMEFSKTIKFIYVDGDWKQKLTMLR